VRSPTTRDDLVCALLVNAQTDSRLLVYEVFRKAGWRLREVQNRKQALQCLARHAVQVVIANGSRPDWPWKKILHDLQRLERPPQLIVTSRLADDSLWSEVLNWGGYDVLAEPLQREEVERVVAAARRHFDSPAVSVPQARMAAAS